jgi:signal transduction histidine kinase
MSTDTATKEAEAVIRDHLEFARALTASFGEGVVAIDRAGRITFLNPAAERLLALPAERALGAPAIGAMQATPSYGEPGSVRSAVEGAMRGETITAETVFAPAGRRPFPVSYTSAPLLRAGATAGAVLVFQDVLAIKRAEVEQRFLSEASAILASSFEYRETLVAVARLAAQRVADACLIELVDERGDVQRLELACVDPLQRVKFACALDAPELRARLRELFSETLARGSALVRGDADAALARALGVRSFVIAPLRSRDGIVGALTLFHADPERHAADVALLEELARRGALAIENARQHLAAQRATRLRDELLATVSHDLRTPLGALLASVGMLLHAPDAVQEASTRRRLETIGRSATNMLRLIQDLLEVAAIEAGQLTVEPATFRIDEVVGDALEALEPLAAAKRLRIVRGRWPQREVVADPGRVHQVLMNILGNAIKFTPPQGEITVLVEVRELESVVQVSISDDGPGISAEDLPHVFDRFWQARATACLGTGLGLPISKKLVEAMGGLLWAESELGRGSAFHFTLPLA